MANYYFLAASLPSLTLGERPEVTYEEFMFRLAVNLHRRDKKAVAMLRRFIDLGNIRLLFLEDEIDPRGVFNEKELDQALLLKDGFPDYVFDFLDQFETIHEKLRFFSRLVSHAFVQEAAHATPFLKRYFKFEREWRLVMLALRAKALQRDVGVEIQFEDVKDPIIAGILAQKDASTYDPPIEYVELKEKYLACGSDPLEQGRAVVVWRLNQIEELADGAVFSIDSILSYMARLLLVEQWSELNDSKGKIILEAFVG